MICELLIEDHRLVFYLSIQPNILKVVTLVGIQISSVKEALRFYSFSHFVYHLLPVLLRVEWVVESIKLPLGLKIAIGFESGKTLIIRVQQLRKACFLTDLFCQVSFFSNFF